MGGFYFQQKESLFVNFLKHNMEQINTKYKYKISVFKKIESQVSIKEVQAR